LGGSIHCTFKSIETCREQPAGKSREVEGKGDEPVFVQSEAVLVSFRTVDEVNEVFALYNGRDS
jgi:hypothetical protein